VQALAREFSSFSWSFFCELDRLGNDQIVQGNRQHSRHVGECLNIACLCSVLDLGNKTLSDTNAFRQRLLRHATMLAPECQRGFGTEQLVGLFAGQQGLRPALNIGQDAVGMCRVRGVLIASTESQRVVFGA